MSARWWILVIGVLMLAYASRTSLREPTSHGFYRFFAFACLLGLVMLNSPSWFHRPLSPLQLMSWVLLVASVLLAVGGFLTLMRRGRPTGSVETTTVLVTNGVYRYVRHPLYASLLCFAWGVVLKDPSPASVVLGLGATALIYWTARAEERESRAKFGSEYDNYRMRTKMFLPYLF